MKEHFVWRSRPSICRSVCLRTRITGLSQNYDRGVIHRTCVTKTRGPVNRLTESYILPKGVNELRHISYILDYLGKIQNKQDRKYMYTVTLKRVHATIVAVEKLWVLHNLSVCLCVCVCISSLGIQHAMGMRHTVICGLVRTTTVFSDYPTNVTIFEKKFLNTKCLSWLSLEICVKIFSFLRRNEQDVIKKLLDRASL